MFNTLLVEGDVSFRQSLSDILLAYFPFIDVDQAADGVGGVERVGVAEDDHLAGG